MGEFDDPSLAYSEVMAPNQFCSKNRRQKLTNRSEIDQNLIKESENGRERSERPKMGLSKNVKNGIPNVQKPIKMSDLNQKQTKGSETGQKQSEGRNMGHPKSAKNGIPNLQKQTGVSHLREKLTEMSKNRSKRVRWSEIDGKLTKRQKLDLPKNGQKQDSDPKKLTKMSEIGHKRTKMSENGQKQTKCSKNRPGHIFRIMSKEENKLYHSDFDKDEDYIEEDRFYIDIGNDTEEDLDIALR